MRLRSLEYRYVWAPALSHIRGSDGSSGGLESTSSSRPCESRDVFKRGKFLCRAAASYLGSRQPVASASTRAVCAAELECEQGQQLLRIVQLSPQFLPSACIRIRWFLRAPSSNDGRRARPDRDRDPSCW